MSDVDTCAFPETGAELCTDAESPGEVPVLSFEQRVDWPHLLDLEDVAVIFKRSSKRAARELLRKAAVPDFKLGGRVYVLRDDLMSRLRELVAEQAEDEPAARPMGRVRRRARRAAADLN